LARSAVRYEGTPGLAIRSLKYQLAVWLAPDLAQLLTAGWRTHYENLTFDGICGVPLHPLKQRNRGFNQAELLGEKLVREAAIPLWRGVLRRVKDSQSQTHLTAEQRTSNVAGVFEVARPRRVVGKRLLLVDDVMTTGATVNECARVLKNAGAESVHVLTVARG
jgi:ComF family protein